MLLRPAGAGRLNRHDGALSAGLLPAVHLEFFYERFAAARPHLSSATLRNYRIALGHVRRYLGREPFIADLTTENLRGLLDALQAAGKAALTINRIRESLVALAHAAVAVALLDVAPRVRKLPRPPRFERRPWPLDELNKLLASARHMPGEVGNVPAPVFWNAFALTLLDVDLPVQAALALPRDAFDRWRGTLTADSHVFTLESRTAAALAELHAYKAPRLFPWTLDGGKPPFHMLLRHFKLLLHRAGLPYVSGNLFDRLRLTGRRCVSILDHIDTALRFQPRKGLPSLPRARDRRERPTRPPKPKSKAKAARPPKLEPETLYLIVDPIGRTLRAFLDEIYIPRRMHQAAEDSIAYHRRTVRKLSEFCACEVTFEQLSEDLTERFLEWVSRGKSAACFNNYRSNLLALWRYAKRKGFVTVEPPEIGKRKPPKRIPEAWSEAEFSRILASAAKERGTKHGIPAADWWIALLLTLYDTGLRLDAVMRAEVSWLDLAGGWLRVPAEFQKQDSEQAFRLHPETLAAILKTGPRGRELLFPIRKKAGVAPAKHFSWVLRKPYRRILLRAGVPATYRDQFHKIRRTSATFVADAAGEMAAMAHLGHSSLAVTYRYIDPTKLTRRAIAADIIPRPSMPKGETL